jgi:hypothetical protein
MVSQLQKVLEKIILPQFPEIGYVEVEELGLGGFYRVHYMMTREMDFRKDYVKLMEETVTLYKMLSPEERGDIIVDFKLIDD